MPTGKRYNDWILGTDTNRIMTGFVYTTGLNNVYTEGPLYPCRGGLDDIHEVLPLFALNSLPFGSGENNL